MEPTLQEFTDLFSEFSSVSNASLSFYLTQSQNEIDETYYGVNYKAAVYLLTAHYLTLFATDSSAGATNIKSVAAGSMRVEYTTENASTGLDPLSRTKYGIQFKRLQQSSNFPGTVVVNRNYSQVRSDA